MTLLYRTKMKEFGTDLTKMQIWRTSFEMKLVLKIWSDMIADMALMFLRAAMTEEESDLYLPLHLKKHQTYSAASS